MMVNAMALHPVQEGKGGTDLNHMRAVANPVQVS